MTPEQWEERQESRRAAATLTEAEKRRFEAWVIAWVHSGIVPSDEGNGEALIYNLVHLIRGDGERYDYKPEQDAELRAWGAIEDDEDCEAGR